MKKVVAVVASLTAALALATPAMAHFCFKTGWNQTAAANAGKSQAWLTANEYIAWVNSLDEAFICQEGKAVATEYFQAQPSNTLFMGPGLLAGGTLKNEKGNTPAHVGYLFVLFGAVDAACGP